MFHKTHVQVLVFWLPEDHRKQKGTKDNSYFKQKSQITFMSKTVLTTIYFTFICFGLSNYHKVHCIIARTHVAIFCSLCYKDVGLICLSLKENISSLNLNQTKQERLISSTYKIPPARTNM